MLTPPTTNCLLNLPKMILHDFQGKIAAQGTPEDLANKGIDFITSDGDGDDGNKEAAGNEPRKSSLSSANPRRSSIDDSISSEDDQNAFCSQLEESAKGKVNGSILLNYFEVRKNWPLLCLLLFSFVATQIVASGADIWIAIWYVLTIRCNFTVRDP